MKNCPSCGRSVPESKRFCSYCGEELSETGGARTEDASVAKGDVRAAVAERCCPSCGKTLPNVAAKFCRHCGASLHVPLPSIDEIAAQSATPSFRSLTSEEDASYRKIQLFLGVTLIGALGVAALVLLLIPNSVPPERFREPPVTHPPSEPPPRPATPGPGARSGVANPTEPFLTPTPTSPVYTPPAPPDMPRIEQGLMLHHSFDSDFQDSSGKGNHGKSFGRAYAANQSGPSGIVAKFDGATGYVEVPDNATLKLQQFTLAAWVFPDEIRGPDGMWIVGNDAYALFILPNGQSAVVSNPAIGVQAPEPVRPLSWQFVVGTNDGQRLSLYVNGSLADFAAAPTPPKQSSYPVTIGRIEDKWYFKGLLDDVRIYNRALTEAEIQQLYRSFSLALIGRVPDK